MRNFEHFIRFFKPEGQGGFGNLYEPKEMDGYMIAKGGDTWRFLMPKSDLGTLKLNSGLRVDLYGKLPNQCNIYGDVNTGIGFIRRQQSELYYEMQFKVNNAPTTDGWRQFSFIRPNGAELFGTFATQESDFDKYCQGIEDWLESYPHTRVDVIRDGNVFKMRMWENGNFRIRNEKITIGLGTVSELNTNTPTLIKQFVETYSRVAYNTYDLVINDVTEGNIFSLSGVSHIATKADTAETVKSILLNGETKVKFNVGSPITISTQLGVRKTVNTNNPKIEKLYQSTVSGQDKYRIEVSNITKGNIFQILISSENPILVTVSESDTISSIESLLNPDSGFLSVNAGATVTVNAVSGVRVDENTNKPQIYVENGLLTAAATVDKYRVFVGTSVRENNKYIIGDFTIIADKVDDYLSIARKLNLIDGQFYEVETTTDFNCYALKGVLYNESNIADILILSSPQRRISQQYLCEVTFPENMEDDLYQVVVKRLPYVIGEELQEEHNILFSNPIKIEKNPKNTQMLRYADLGENYGYDYTEEGISQQVRVKVYLKNEKFDTTQVQRQSVNDATIKGQITLRKRFDFVVAGYGAWYHRALEIALNHGKVFLDKMRVSLNEYNRDDTEEKVTTATGNLYEEDYLMTNFGGLWLNDESYKEKLTIKANFNEKIIALIICNNYFRKEIIERGEIFVPVIEFTYKVFVAGGRGDTVKMRVYQNGVLLQTIILFCNIWNKSTHLFRGYPSDVFYFEEVNEESSIVDITTKLETIILANPIAYAAEIGTINELNGDINPILPPSDGLIGQWRKWVDEDGNYVIQVIADIDSENNPIWVSKYITGNDI